MIVVCYTVINDVWDPRTLHEKLSHLSQHQRERVLAYNDIHDQQLRLQGKLLTEEVMKQMGVHNYLPADIMYNEYNKPYINNGVDFNISHAGNIVMCAGIKDGKIGADIEAIKPLNIADVRDVFFEDEWNRIINNVTPIETLYKLWTRKEAILKAAGKGMLGEPSKIKVINDDVTYENEMYSLYSITIKDGYASSIAANKAGEQLQILQMD